MFGTIPRIDPLKKNYEKFRNYYEGFILLFVLYLLAIQIQIILWGFGYEISPNAPFPSCSEFCSSTSDFFSNRQSRTGS